MAINRRSFSKMIAVAVLVYSGLAFGGGFDVTWHTIDAGGVMNSTGGDFELSGSIGQPDANAMTLAAGDLEFTGGFWAVAVPNCACPSDVSNDTVVNGDDIPGFVDCLLVGVGSNCVCADVAADGVLDLADVSAFVDDLLTGQTCP